MNYKYRLLGLMAFAAVFLMAFAGASPAFIGSASIHAPAVIVQTNQGTLTTIALNVTAGTGYVTVIGPNIVGNSTLSSARQAAAYASSYLGVSFSNYNFTYDILNHTTNVSGPSAGAAMTLLAISAISHKQLRQDFTITGTISSNGDIGEIGGVYDKVSAAKSAGMYFVMVPAVPSTSSENELYYLVQNEFSIPLVQVANVSYAAKYAFNTTMNLYSHETYYNFYTHYNASSVPQAPLACSNSCNGSTFVNLTLFTFNITAQQISALGTNSSFANVSRQLLQVLNQSMEIASKGYLYTGADFAFLDYVNAFYFGHHTTNITMGMGDLQNIMYSCAALSPAQLTNTNYEYVLAGELRQAWANFTVNSTIGLYNLTAIDTDGVLDALYEGGEAQGWCSAAGFLYNASASMGGAPVVLSPALKSIAASRLERASQYQGLYLSTASQAYKAGNYALAMLGADYAYALYAPIGNTTTQALISSADALSANATFGIWATQYANEARFYVYEASTAANASVARGYALQAHSVAMLAQQVSNDTLIISKSITQASAQQIGNAQIAASLAELEASVASLQNDLYAIAIIEVAEIAAFAVIIILVVLLLNKQKAQAKRAGRLGMRGRRS